MIKSLLHPKKLYGIRILSWFLLAGLTACSYSELSSMDPTQLVQAAQQTLTAAPVQADAQPSPTQTLPPEITLETPSDSSPAPSATPEVTALPIITATAPEPTPSLPCNVAKAGMPLDVTMPDGSQLGPGQGFNKTWRLINGGSCTWTPTYAIVWFSGMSMGSLQVQNLRAPVKPGEWVDISIDLVAPEQPGMYQSNWKLQDPQGNLFGLGPNGDAPIWVRIEVVDFSQPPTSEPEPTATPLPEVVSSGSSEIKVGDGFDFDSGAINTGVDDDTRLERGPEAVLQLTPSLGAKAALFGERIPVVQDCLNMPYPTGPVILAETLDNNYFCYITTANLPGFVSLSNVEASSDQYVLTYLTWSMP